MYIELKEKQRNYFTSSLEAFSMSALGASPCVGSNPLSTNHMRELGFLTFAATDGAGHQKIIYRKRYLYKYEKAVDFSWNLEFFILRNISHGGKIT